jgi:molybdate transport system substrate-binding protein
VRTAGKARGAHSKIKEEGMRSGKLLLIVILAMQFIVSGCAPGAVPATQAAQKTRTLTVLAAASLTESFNALGQLFETQHPGVNVAFVYAGSQQLVQQLNQGADADVFASASLKYMDAAVQAKRVDKASAKTFVVNRLVAIYPKANPGGITALKDLARPGLKIVLADKAVPVGQYSLDFLNKANLDPVFGAAYRDNVLKNVVSYEDNVKSVFTKVSLGEADAGIVYVTDITGTASDRVDRIAIPDSLNTIAAYPIAPLNGSKNADLANDFLAMVLSPDGQAIMARFGFLPGPDARGP